MMVLDLIIFGGGFLIGTFLGIIIMAIAAAGGRDSRLREQMEEKENEERK